MMAFSSAVEPLRMANQISGETLYEWRILSTDNQPVKASNGISILPDSNIDDIGSLDTLFVCSGVNVRDTWSKPLLQVLHKVARRGISLGSLCTATYLLSKAGLLNGYRCTTHWENLAGMREEFPNVIYTEELFELDRDRYTCSGGSAPLDMMLRLIKDQYGPKLANSISEMFICERIRDKHDRQKIPLLLQLGTSQPKLTEAIELMEANIEEPMSLNELASLVGISRRQLERLFQKHIHCVPTRHYLELRLKRARQLLLQTDKSIVDVGLACGFVSAPHFSKCYRDHYGFPPRDERRRRCNYSEEILT